MIVKQIMSSSVITVGSCTGLKQAAELMKQQNVAMLIVISEQEPLGTVTDRDIVLRAVSTGRNLLETTVAEVMTVNYEYCLENQTVDEVFNLMREQQVIQLPVVDGDNKLTGLISMTDISPYLHPTLAGQVIQLMSDLCKATVYPKQPFHHKSLGQFHY